MRRENCQEMAKRRKWKPVETDTEEYWKGLWVMVPLILFILWLCSKLA